MFIHIVQHCRLMGGCLYSVKQSVHTDRQTDSHVLSPTSTMFTVCFTRALCSIVLYFNMILCIGVQSTVRKPNKNSNFMNLLNLKIYPLNSRI